MISEEFSDFLSVSRIFVDTEFKIFAKLFIEFLIIFIVFGNFAEEFHAFLHNVFLNDL
jgi:hypothetical protein